MTKAKACFPGSNKLRLGSPMSALVVKAHAKINLYLEVGLRLDSGYHRVTSVMQTISLADVLTVTPHDNIQFSCNDDSLNKDNLVEKAANLLVERYAPEAGAKISLSKNIPVAAGLAGGSTDAAATLKALNVFWDLGLSLEDLSDIGSELGADVPFCLTGGTALVTGIGEEVRSLKAADLGPVLIIKPPGGLSSGAVYEKFDELPRTTSGNDRASHRVNRVIDAIAADDREALISACANDLEAAASLLNPDIVDMQERVLAAGASLCLVSGSGPALFALAETPEKLDEIRALAALSASTWIVSGVGHALELLEADNKLLPKQVIEDED